MKKKVLHQYSRDPNNTSQEGENNDKLDQKMAPAAKDSYSDAEIALNYNQHQDTSFNVVGAASFKDPLVVARAMIEEHQRNQNDAEEKLVAILRARQLEARKEQELDLARAIRRHHEDEQVQKQLMSMHREGGLMKRDNELMNMAVSGGQDPSLRSEETSRKRRFEGDFFRNVFQRKQDEMTLLNDIKFSRHQNIMQPGGTRRIPLTNYDQGLSALPFPPQTALPQSLSSRAPTFLEDQAYAERLQRRNNSQFNRNDFHNDISQAILNALYSSTSGPTSSNQDVSSLHKYFNAANTSTLTASGNLNNMHANIPTSGTNFSSIANTGAGADWLCASKGGAAANSILMRASSLQQEKPVEEGQDDLIINSNYINAADNLIGMNEVASELDEEQQQKRFNKHQCKQWTIKFHELLAFKGSMGHCNVPHGYKDNLALAMWVKRQRHQYNLMVDKKTSTLTGERIKLLENLGFVWNCLETAWEQHFQDLHHFVMRTGHCAVPSTYKRNPRLASWVVTQRRQCKLLEDGKQSSMTRKRLEKLVQIGFPVKTKKAGTNMSLKK